ncbi:F-box domain [Lasallia pustulata]|uniref:F-box domain n=1 Tax=Lasallia pustulata TaxID=136370 RepID=A0A1W5D0N3_9LECA|nr:F-box domain [Lasallia pustulata]
MSPDQGQTSGSSFLGKQTLPNSANMAQTPTLSTIPVELQLNIIGFLHYPTLQILRTADRHFRHLIDMPKIRDSTPHDELMRELVAAARSDEFLKTKNLFACRYCLQLLPENRFGDRRRKRVAHDWFCIDCGLLRSKYKPGKRITCMGVPGVYCLGCREFKQGECRAPDEAGSYCRRCRQKDLVEWRGKLEKEARLLEIQRRAKKERSECGCHYETSGDDLDDEQETLEFGFSTLARWELRMSKKKVLKRSRSECFSRNRCAGAAIGKRDLRRRGLCGRDSKKCLSMGKRLR